MRTFLLAMMMLGAAGSGWAQTPPRFEVGAVTRSDRASFEGRANGRLAVVGGVASVRFGRHLGVEGELTTASGTVNHSYEGDFISYAAPGASREEILEQAVIGRRNRSWAPGLGGSIAFTVRSPGTTRVGVMLRTGVAFRKYTHTESTTILRVPEGISVERAAASLPGSTGHQTRGGLMLGMDLPIRITRRVSLAPEVRWVWGGPARVGNNYDEGSFGARAIWTF